MNLLQHVNELLLQSIALSITNSWLMAVTNPASGLVLFLVLQLKKNFQYFNQPFWPINFSLHHPPSLELRWVIVENIGVEPMTSCVQGRRSSQLS